MPDEPSTCENTAADCCSIRAMKNLLSIASTLIIGSALALGACGKDKKPSTTDPAVTEPAKTDPAKADPNAAAKPDDKKADDKPAGGW
jgi:ABC-type oligopeptide transport system substrate-binding subunit